MAVTSNSEHHSRRFGLNLLMVGLLVAVISAACSNGQTAADSSPSTNQEDDSVDAVDQTETSEAVSPTSTSTTDWAAAEELSNSEDQSGNGVCPERQPGAVETTVTGGGNDYEVRILLPPNYGGAPLPVVLNWHGLGSNGPEQAALTDYERLATSEGFVVVHPTGLSSATSGSARGWELAQLDVPGRDDVDMAGALIDLLVDQYCADPNRIYSTGMSNGGFFTSRLVCDLSERIAAAVSVAGISHPDDCDPTRTLPYAAYHGTDDQVVPFAEGESSLASDSSPAEIDAFFDQVMPDEFAEFASDFRCRPEPTQTEISAEVIQHAYNGCSDGVEMVFYEVVGGGHTWPGSPWGALMEGFVGLTTDDVSASEDGWAFMSRYSLAD